MDGSLLHHVALLHREAEAGISSVLIPHDASLTPWPDLPDRRLADRFCAGCSQDTGDRIPGEGSVPLALSPFSLRAAQRPCETGSAVPSTPRCFCRRPRFGMSASCA